MRGGKQIYNINKLRNMDGLVIKKYWLNKILSGTKDIEIRGQRTKKIGQRIYLLSDSFVYGTAVICDCIKLNKFRYEYYQYRGSKGIGHQINMDYNHISFIYPNVYAWFLTDIQRIQEKRYKHPRGAVIWVKDVNSKILQ